MLHYMRKMCMLNFYMVTDAPTTNYAKDGSVMYSESQHFVHNLKLDKLGELSLVSWTATLGESCKKEVFYGALRWTLAWCKDCLAMAMKCCLLMYTIKSCL